MTRKKDPRAAERATHLAVALYPNDAARFDTVLAESGLTRSGWVRGAIRAAASDPDIASAITRAGDTTPHGGRRPGAGRPPGTSNVSDPDGKVKEQQDKEES